MANLNVSSGDGGEQSFQAGQLAFAAHLRDPAVNPAPLDIEDRRLAIYRDLIYNNIEAFLTGGFPVLRSLMSDDNWHRLVRGFVKDHRCHTPYFLEISQEFLLYLREGKACIPADLPFIVELTHYEWVELALDVSPEELPEQGLLSAQADALLDASLQISPLAWRLNYSYPVHKISLQFQPLEAPEQPTSLVVYRGPDEKIHFFESNAVTMRLLQLLENGQLSGRQALGQVALELAHPEPETLVAMGESIIQQLLDLSILYKA
ncbi:MAG: putative DNA-binding domain-containing protein [Gammaproteobacteria bacterium]|nr:putative DNA-binding domain-containing protein [Gammaproteobacteria bacterium]MBQ0840193.1 putative DNA-binding domain-containing protein [Gammaproteobacteria bacterium]